MPIALGILAASGQIACESCTLKSLWVSWLNGRITAYSRRVVGQFGGHKRRTRLYVPSANAQEAAYPQQAQVYGIRHLKRVVC